VLVIQAGFEPATSRSGDLLALLGRSGVRGHPRAFKAVCQRALSAASLAQTIVRLRSLHPLLFGRSATSGLHGSANAFAKAAGPDPFRAWRVLLTYRRTVLDADNSRVQRRELNRASGGAVDAYAEAESAP
jgi:hypothetical protein